jgi:hypothetical protein
MSQEQIKDRLIKDLADLSGRWKVNKKGEIEDRASYQQFQELLHIFMPIFWQHNKERQQALEELKCTLVEPETFFGEGWAAIFRRLKKEGKVSYSRFQRQVDRITSDTRRLKTLEHFTLVFPVNVCFIKKIALKIGEDDFEIISYDDFKKNFYDIDEIIAEADEDLRTQRPLTMQKQGCRPDFSYLVLTTAARDYNFAFEYATARMFAILALLIFARRKHSVPYAPDFRAPIKISTLALSCGLIFQDKNYVDCGYLGPQAVSEQDWRSGKLGFVEPTLPEVFGETDLDNFKQLASKYDKISLSDLSETFDRVLKAYYEACVENRPEYSFFSYWVSIESLLKVNHMTYEEMRETLLNLLGGAYYLELVVDLFLSVRHNFAHELTTDVAVPPRLLAKQTCDLLIEWFLFEYGRQFTNKAELRKIYRFVREDDSSLRNDKKIIDDILKHRTPVSGNSDPASISPR